jgi:Flp pilus assembly protein TadD
MRASTLDEDPTTFDEAETLYKKAIDLDPQLAIAYTNLGNIRFRRGDEPGAEALSDKARARAHSKRYLELEPTGTWADIARDHL